MNDRLPPHDIEAERAVIGAVAAFTSRALPLVSALSEGDFFDTSCREAWAAVRALERRGVDPEAICIADELKARGTASRFAGSALQWAIECAGKSPILDVLSSYVTIVHEKATLRSLIELGTEVVNSAYGDQHADELLSRARAGIADLEVSGASTESGKLGLFLPEALANVEKKARGERVLVAPYGISTLENILGGKKPGQLIIIAGRPGHGKTALADCLATLDALAGIPNMFLSLEMSRQEIAERVVGAHAKVNVHAIGTGKIEYSEWKRLQNAASELYEVPLFIEKGARELSRIVSRIYQWHAREVRAKKLTIGVATIDYAQLVRVDKSFKCQNREQEVGTVSRTLKSLADELSMPIVLVCQINREVEKRGGPPMPSDLRESGSLEQDADVIIFPYRDLPAADQAARNKSGPAQLIVAKHRNGPTGIASANWTAELMQFTAATGDDYDGPDTRSGQWGERDE
jgi:replicative DNA helicase